MQSKEEGNRFSLGRACDIMASGGGFIFDWPVFYAVSAGTLKSGGSKHFRSGPAFTGRLPNITRQIPS
ncbi:hypothetical protein GMD61_10160 [Pseudoflavonifractor sp. BIOML-A9]|nr:hypothetical protein [Pseudoflavonifractor sp. BIOML-A9]